MYKPAPGGLDTHLLAARFQRMQRRRCSSAASSEFQGRGRNKTPAALKLSSELQTKKATAGILIPVKTYACPSNKKSSLDIAPVLRLKYVQDRYIN